MQPKRISLAVRTPLPRFTRLLFCLAAPLRRVTTSQAQWSYSLATALSPYSPWLCSRRYGWATNGMSGVRESGAEYNGGPSEPGVLRSLLRQCRLLLLRQLQVLLAEEPEPRPLRPVLAARVAAAHVALQSMSATATGSGAVTWGPTRQRSSDAVSEHFCEALNQGIEWVRGSPFALRALDRFGIDPDPCTPPAGPSPWPAHPTRCARWRRSTKGRSPWRRASPVGRAPAARRCADWPWHKRAAALQARWSRSRASRRGPSRTERWPRAGLPVAPGRDPGPSRRRRNLDRARRPSVIALWRDRIGARSRA